MDYLTLNSYNHILNDFKAGKEFTGEPTAREYYDLVEQVKTDRAINDSINILSIDGIITKYGGASHYGMREMGQMLIKADAENNVKGHIIVMESGGGSTNAIPEMTEAMQQVTKPIVVWVDGIMASAAMYIGSYADYIFASRSTDMIGSIGTMIEFAGKPKQAENGNTKDRFVRIYANKSTNKNGMFEEAINNYNFKPIQEKMLNPANEQFIQDIKANRPNVREIELTGEIFKASEVVGTLIDEIGTFQQAIDKVVSLTEQKEINTKLNTNMNLTELKSKHPELFAEAVNIGVSQENDRVGAWMAFVEIDPKAVKEGINSGENVSQTFMAEMAVKQMKSKTINDLEKGTVEEVTTTTPKNDEAKALEAFEKELNELK